MTAAPHHEEPFDFRIEADRLILAAGFVADIPAKRILAEIERAQTLGPILDPTLYREAQAAGHLSRLVPVARAAVAMQDAYRAIREHLAADALYQDEGKAP